MLQVAKRGCSRTIAPGSLLAVVATGAFLFVGVTTVGCGGDDTTSGNNPSDGGTMDGPAGDTGPGVAGGGGDGSGGDSGDGGTPGDPGNFTMVTGIANSAADFVSPFDSTPDPAGTTGYFTAVSPTDGTSGVFKVAAAGGAIRQPEAVI